MGISGASDLNYVNGQLSGVLFTQPLPNRSDNKLRAIDTIWLNEGFKEREHLARRVKPALFTYDRKITTSHFSACSSCGSYDASFFNPNLNYVLRNEHNPSDLSSLIARANVFHARYMESRFPTYETKTPAYYNPWSESSPHPLSVSTNEKLFDNLKRWTTSYVGGIELTQNMTVSPRTGGQYGTDEPIPAVDNVVSFAYWHQQVGRRQLYHNVQYGFAEWKKVNQGATQLSYDLPKGITATSVSRYACSITKTFLDGTSQSDNTNSGGIYCDSNPLTYDSTSGKYILDYGGITSRAWEYFKGTADYREPWSIESDPFDPENDNLCSQNYEVRFTLPTTFILVQLGNNTKWW